MHFGWVCNNTVMNHELFIDSSDLYRTQCMLTIFCSSVKRHFGTEVESAEKKDLVLNLDVIIMIFIFGLQICIRNS